MEVEFANKIGSYGETLAVKICFGGRKMFLTKAESIELEVRLNLLNDTFRDLDD